jgi:hypothetical protein
MDENNTLKSAQAKINEAMALLLDAQKIINHLNTESPTLTTPKEAPPPEEAPSVVNHSKEDAICALLGLAISAPENEDELVKALNQIIHSSVSNNPHALSALIRYNWSRLCNQKSDYLSNPADPKSFTVIREQPLTHGEAEESKIFLETRNRNPTPCTVKKESNGAWKVSTFSL